MMIVRSGMVTETTEQAGRHGRPLAAHSWWMPAWLQRRQEERALERWATELGWKWSDAADIAHLTRHSTTAAKIPLTVAPQVHSVELGPPVTLLVRMLPGQIVDDFEARAHRLAAAMDVPAVHIEPYEPGWVKVVLLDEEPDYE